MKSDAGLISAAVAGALGVAGAAGAGLVPVQSYDMVNGRSGFQRYVDETYTGAGNPLADSSFLSGGTGQLTDGADGGDDILANSSLPWVGWREVQPSIRFDFGHAVRLDLFEVHAASISAMFGDVDLPGTITVDFSDDGTTFVNPVVRTTSPTERANPLSQWIDVSLGGMVARYARARFADGDQPWLFFSETRFGGVVPAPGAGALALVGAVLAGRRRRREADSTPLGTQGP